MEKNTKKKIIIGTFAAISLLVLAGCGCKPKTPPKIKVSLTLWTPFDDRSALSGAIGNYNKLNPNITISIKKISADTYRQDIINAMASGTQPDIFLIQNNWVPVFGDKIASAPATSPVVTEQKFRKDFVDVVANDFISDGKIYAVPLSVDSLALYYNKDLFNQAGITAPPTDWSAFVEDVGKLTKISKDGTIVQAGAALGTSSKNINRATDILGLLMMQSGSDLSDGKAGRATFAQTIGVGASAIRPGVNALNFYTAFANNSSKYYTWNPAMHYSLDAFSEGTLGMMFNYSWHIATIQKKSPKLNFAVAPVPQQPDTPAVDYANYWGFAVSKNQPNPKSKAQKAVANDNRIYEAWKFLTYLTTKADADSNAVYGVGQTNALNKADGQFDPAKNYLWTAKAPAARRDIIDEQRGDPYLGAFVQQNLIAKSWYEADPEVAEGILDNMIDQVNRGAVATNDAISKAAAQITQLMAAKRGR